MKSVLSPLGVLVCVGLAVAVGCRTTKPDRPPPGAPDAQARPPVERVDYVDSDAFDAFLETALVNRQPVVVVQTGYDKPEWSARLNEWIAAWNTSRRAPGLRVRGQIPAVPSVVVDGDSIREFRLLIDGLMGRVEESARVGGHWWAERHTRERRVALLRPYSLRFHLGADGHIQLIFFHGDYAAQYKDVVRALADPAEEETSDWSPGYSCSLARPRVSRRAAE
ncbi:MAG: hypothetical protein J0I06_16840 [Planctomycetes bacterium]|nr:hypothetical protein [Planctomycetota bacterium]